jgi:membrane protease YdiL (CAAX protease family)
MESKSNSLYNLSPAMRFVLFLATTGISMMVGALVSFSLVAYLLKVPFNELQNIILQPEHSNMAQFANALASIIAFGVPCVILAFFSEGTLVQNLGFKKNIQIEQIGLVVLIALTGLLLSGSLGDITEKLTWSTSIRNWADGLEAQYKKALMAMTQMKSLVDLLFAMIAVALIPAVVEELFFRATLQKIIIDWSGKPILSIIITAIIFSAFHFSYFGFLSRMSLGIVIGFVYYFSKNIWLPILLHFINNGIGIIALFLVKADAKKVETVVEGNLSYYWVFVAIIAVYILLKKLNKISHHAGLEKSVQ